MTPPSHVIYDTLQSAQLLHQSEIDAPIQYANNLISDMCEDMKKEFQKKEAKQHKGSLHFSLLIAVTFSVSLLLQDPGFSQSLLDMAQ